MSVSTVLKLTDQMTGQLRAIHQANQQLLNDYQTLSGTVINVDTASAQQSIHELTGGLTEAQAAQEELSGGAVILDTSDATQNIDELTGGLADAAEAQQDLDEELEEAEEQLRQARQEQERYNDSMARGREQAEGLSGGVKKLAGAFLGFLGISSAKNFVTDSLAAFDTQLNSERQLQTVLYNVGAGPDAFGNLAATAGAIQSNTLYGDEAMLGGAGEFATYISDEAAIQHMMGTLSNYAAGMSGGGEVGKQQMVEYATQLGKALDGTYDGLLKKGFTLTEQQKQIIENGTDMEKALVLDEVINQSWAGLAEQMANTPQGQIIQFKNNLGDLTEVVGGRLYPSVMALFGNLNQNMPQIESAMTAFASGASMVIYGLSEIVSLAGSGYQLIADNWGAIGPVVYGAAGAFVVYNGVLLAHKGYVAAAAAWDGILAARQTILAIRAGTATAAQAGFNMTLLASPVTWFAGGVLLGVVALYSFTGMLNEAAGTTYSATGLIAGLFSAMGTAIVRVFLWFGDIALGVLQAIAEAVDFVMDSDYAGTVAGWRDNLKGIATEKFSLGDAFDKGYSWGKGMEGKLKNFSPLNLGNLDQFSFEAGLGNMALPDISDSVGDIANDTGSIKKSLEISEEELKYLRDIAEREVINRFTTAEIKIDMQNINQVQSDADIDGIVEKLVEKVYEGVSIAAEGR